MLTCKVGENIINCYDGIHSKEQLKKWASKNILICPVCEKSYEYCHGEFKSPYFRHKDKCECEDRYSEPESQEHIDGKRDLYEWIKTQDGVSDAVLEGWVPETKQRPDIMFKYNEKQYVIEYQCTPIASEYIERHELYQAGGIEDIWILGTSKYLNKNVQSQKKNRTKVIEGYSNYYYDSKNKIFIYNKFVQDTLGYDIEEFKFKKYSDIDYENQILNIDTDLISCDTEKFFTNYSNIILHTNGIYIDGSILNIFINKAKLEREIVAKIIEDTRIMIDKLKVDLDLNSFIFKEFSGKFIGKFSITFKHDFWNNEFVESNTFNANDEIIKPTQFIEKYKKVQDMLNIFNNELSTINNEHKLLKIEICRCYSSPTYYYTINEDGRNIATRNNFTIPVTQHAYDEILSGIRKDLLDHEDIIYLKELINPVITDIRKTLDKKYRIYYDSKSMEISLIFGDYCGNLVKHKFIDNPKQYNSDSIYDFIYDFVYSYINSVQILQNETINKLELYKKKLDKYNKNSDVNIHFNYILKHIDKKETAIVRIGYSSSGRYYNSNETELFFSNDNYIDLKSTVETNVLQLLDEYINNYNRSNYTSRLVYKTGGIHD